MSKFKSGDRVITTRECGWYEPGETLTKQADKLGEEIWKGNL